MIGVFWHPMIVRHHNLTELPQSIGFQRIGEGLLKVEVKVRARDFQTGGQRKAEDLAFGNLPGLGVMFGDGLGFGQRGIIHDRHLTAVSPGQLGKDHPDQKQQAQADEHLE